MGPVGTWSGKRDSNSRPQPWQGCALPTELFPRKPTCYRKSGKHTSDFTFLTARKALWPNVPRLAGAGEKQGPYRGPVESGAGNETRTRDLNLGKVALYQLSYSRRFFDLRRRSAIVSKFLHAVNSLHIMRSRASGLGYAAPPKHGHRRCLDATSACSGCWSR